MFKRLVAIATATVLTVAMSVSAFAAASATQKAEILDAVTKGGYVTTSDSVYKEISDFLDQPSVTITSTSDIIAQIDDVKKLAKENNLTTVAALKEELAKNPTSPLATKVSTAIKSAATSAGVKNVTIDFTKSNIITSVEMKDGTKLTVGDGTIKKTGVDFSTTAAVVAGLGLSVAGIAVIAKKKDLVNA